MRRLAVAVAVVLGLGVAPAVSGVTAEAAAPPDAAADNLRSDFNSDGFADLAIGVPGESVGSAASAGAVNVLYGTPPGLTGSGSQYLTQNTPGVWSTAEERDNFGAALATGDFNHDGFPDLAIGAFGESVGTPPRTEAGAVNVLYGGAAGLTGSGSQYFTQNSPGVWSTAETNDGFGSALAVGDFNTDGFADLVIGVSHESVGTPPRANAGAVNVLYGTPTGLIGSGSQYVTQNTPGVPNSAERNDFFGGTLAAGDFDHDGFADLAVGAPGESSTMVAVGAVNVLYGDAAGLTEAGGQFFYQNTPGVPGSAFYTEQFGHALTAGDFNTDGFADLAIGVRDDSDEASRAGAVNVLYGSAAGLTVAGSQFLSQNSPGVPNTAEVNDEFGWALAVGDFDHDGYSDLAVGVMEDIGNIDKAGAVNTLCGTPARLTGSGCQYVTQNTTGVPDAAEAYDQFGQALAAAAGP
jgi:FG-GAP repeat